MNPEENSKKVSVWSIITLLLGILGLTYFAAFSSGSSLYLEITVASAALAILIGIVCLIALRKKQSSLGKAFAIIGIILGLPTILFVAVVAKFIFDLSVGN